MNELFDSEFLDKIRRRHNFKNNGFRGMGGNRKSRARSFRGVFRL